MTEVQDQASLWAWRARRRRTLGLPLSVAAAALGLGLAWLSDRAQVLVWPMIAAFCLAAFAPIWIDETNPEQPWRYAGVWCVVLAIATVILGLQVEGLAGLTLGLFTLATVPVGWLMAAIYRQGEKKKEQDAKASSAGDRKE